MIRVLVSSCLLGQPVRYNGSDAPSDKKILSQWQREGRLVNFCPEIAAGFPTPRPPAETVGGDGKMVLLGQAKVFEDTGADVTEMFVDGAKKAYSFSKNKNVRLAILTDGSPSCGSTYVYDGNFTGGQVPGKGVTAELLEQKGIRVFSEDHIEDALIYLKSLEESDAQNEK
ncbi:MAG: DUF523 domain-containing protein [Anaerolineales bacterium]|uniref:DUF523 domain-containing protein n=1 Tax=Candidatus Desulfolinea nitratireducens TaxID=2841698 RepID=A0A8J6TF08_9CHLR|nr:DUF523 domain-containing protein [Candidatus Desulfolinea nitratireducens]MBL6960353.1 DUF523 domain-containing protein [Anaerolineales bacterium]